MKNNEVLTTQYGSIATENDDGSASALDTDSDARAEETTAAPPGAPEADAGTDGQSFKLSYENDGVYFETTGGIDNDTAADIINHIKRKNLNQPNMGEVGRALRESPCRACIAPPQKEYFYDETAVITISSDQMEASVRLLPPDTGGNRLTYQQLVVEASSKGVTYGIDENVLKEVYESRAYGKNVRFATGTMPEDGTDGELVFHFNTELLGTPAIDEKTGKVDYKNLNLFVQVTEGQQLVSRIPATPGTLGYTVTGRMISPKSGREAKLPAGKNVTYDEERLNMYAGVTGRVDYKNQTITVSSCYTVSGDADLSIGNIMFDGDVLVKGNVISDITIQATRNIEVNGVAEGAKLIAGGNIVLKNGMQGNDKGIIEAEGDVTAKYIERSKVRAEGNVTVDALIHCRAESSGSIVAKGKHGVIIGGSIKAGNSITAQSIGSEVNTRTNIEVGLPPSKRERLKFLVAETERLQVEIDKFEKIITYLSHMENLPPEKKQMKKTVIVEKVRDTKLLSEHVAEINALEEDIKKAESGKVHVTDTIYPGVRLMISLGEYMVPSPIKYSTFYCKDRVISFTSCQI